jgi:hypothetical protein
MTLGGPILAARTRSHHLGKRHLMECQQRSCFRTVWRFQADLAPEALSVWSARGRRGEAGELGEESVGDGVLARGVHADQFGLLAGSG